MVIRREGEVTETIIRILFPTKLYAKPEVERAKNLHSFDGSYISVHPDLSRPILVRPSSENHSGSKGLRLVR